MSAMFSKFFVMGTVCCLFLAQRNYANIDKLWNNFFVQKFIMFGLRIQYASKVLKIYDFFFQFKFIRFFSSIYNRKLVWVAKTDSIIYKLYKPPHVPPRIVCAVILGSVVKPQFSTKLSEIGEKYILIDTKWLWMFYFINRTLSIVDLVLHSLLFEFAI